MAYFCVTCLAGTYQPFEGAKEYSVDNGFTDLTTSDMFLAYGYAEGTGCLLCPAGFYCDIDGMGPKNDINDHDDPALNGDSNLTFQPQPCPAGYYCEQGVGSGGATYTGACPTGYYSSLNYLRDIGQCWLCKEGHYCDLTVPLATTGECDAGYYCIYGATEAAPSGVTSTAIKLVGTCPAHHFCEAGSGYGIPCPPGTFDDLSDPTTPNTSEA
jgi:hypothetical protein